MQLSPTSSTRHGDLTAREYKHLKGLHPENLRDHMTNEELAMNMLAELTPQTSPKKSTLGP